MIYRMKSSTTDIVRIQLRTERKKEKVKRF